MIAEHILGNIHETPSDKKPDTVKIEWFEHDKHLIKKFTDGGIEIGIRIHEPLRDGDIIYEDDDSIVIVEILPTELIKITVSNMVEMGRSCFEIGNRHLPLAISENCVKIPYDAPTFEYLKKLGFRAETVTEKFTGYTECRAHTHTHSHN